MNASRVRALEQQLLAHMQLYGYTLIDIPIVQPADVFLTRAGDLMIERLFTFEHHDQMLALRPEFTAAAARHYLEHANGQVVRWQFCGATFVDDAARDRQQHSLGAELIGMAGSAAEAEIIIAKQRSGPTGVVKVTWLGHLTRFTNYAPTDFGMPSGPEM